MTSEELITKIKIEIDKLYDEYKDKFHQSGDQYHLGLIDGLDMAERVLDTLESEKTISPWKKIHTYTEEIHEGDMEKMLLKLSVGKGEKRTKTALPDRIVDTLESEKPIDQDEELNNEIKAFVNEYGYEKSEDILLIAIVARHFAQFGAEHTKIDVTDFCKPIDPGIAQCIADHSWEMLGEDEKPVPADLEEAAENYIAPIENDEGLDYINFNGRDIKDAFIAGAKWMSIHGNDIKEL